ncbi:hypothetical protein [Sphingobacterium bovistauri]|uniref:Uncharacterized protein n=1 Tax=Sphingobacterium bovistauri TaxID=2781959 RepID=A0ABS7Z5B9_9SPHI|nr:hypothetical protein [Sphingobacterium bovistauri]MCA5005208.1 hypothetical protein [Sphingobacterium bovistauri]
MKVILDKEGYKELIVPEEYKLLTEYFSTDIQSVGGEYELMLLHQFQESDKDYQEIGVGNAFPLIFKKDSVTIENMFTDKLLSDIPIDFYEKCLQSWIEIKNINDERNNK